MEKILFIRSDRFGEFLLSLPAIKFVKDNFPRSKVCLLAQKSNISLIKDVDFIDRFIEYRPGFFQGYAGAFRLAALFRKERADCVVMLNPKKEFHLASFLAGIPLRVGYDRKWGFCLNRKIDDKKFLAEKHEVEYNIDLVSLICGGGKVPAINFPVESRRSLDVLARVIDLDKKYIVVHPFASNPEKKIERDFWGELIERLKLTLKEEIVLIGLAEEREEASLLGDKCPVKNLAGSLSLRNLAALFKHNCLLHVGLDSGPMHLASFLGIPVVGIFKISSFRRWKPLGRDSLTINGRTLADFQSKIEEIIFFAEKYKTRVKGQ